MQINTDGIVIKEMNIGETDRIVTILTRDLGVVKASARGSRRLKSPLSSATQLFCLSRFTFFKGRDLYIINSADSISNFYHLRTDLIKLSIAQYFAEISAFLAPENENADDFLRLILNALHLLIKNDRPPDIIKAAFELRLLSLAGYQPDIAACRNCGVFEGDVMYLLTKSGQLVCENCKPVNEPYVAMNKGVLTAFRHIIYSEFDRIFSFNLPQESIKLLTYATQSYLLTHLERVPQTLEFYNSLF